MKFLKTLVIFAVPLVFLLGCETPGENKSSLANKAAMQAQNKLAMQAQKAAKRAADAANAAAASAAAAARAAESAAAEAKAAGDKADRVFRKGMRK